MTTLLDAFDSRIRDLAEREKECDGLFEEIKNGNAEKSLLQPRHASFRPETRAVQARFKPPLETWGPIIAAHWTSDLDPSVRCGEEVAV